MTVYTTWTSVLAGSVVGKFVRFAPLIAGRVPVKFAADKFVRFAPLMAGRVPVRFDAGKLVRDAPEPEKVVAVTTPAFPNWILLPILIFAAVILFDTPKLPVTNAPSDWVAILVAPFPIILTPLAPSINIWPLSSSLIKRWSPLWYILASLSVPNLAILLSGILIPSLAVIIPTESIFVTSSYVSVPPIETFPVTERVPPMLTLY